jgi:hypothetical protein
MGEIPAGRELDALIAENVFGWLVNRSDNHWHTVGETGRERHILIGRDCCADKYDGGAFCPSANIADAWRVVEKLRGDFHMHRTPGNGYACEFAPREFLRSVAYADTAPHAICLAALKAVGVREARG